MAIAADAFDLRPVRKTTIMGVPVADATGTDIEDVDSWGGIVELILPVKPVTVYLGVGYQQSDVENPPAALFESDVATATLFINGKYNLTDNFYIQPEIVWFDYGHDAMKTLPGNAPGENDLGSELFAGVHFQADF